ncbi:GNAT family N-acetyltransferase [Ursidibacter arcticus]|uniref:GNAT family N-acetyltransferase n=1 Tax=Ursidibacter arcticus TaxID=1524965 RepID=UPI001F086D77|nr:GNAT family N-acetyltransferase [Ursidibacter arcticus]
MELLKQTTLGKRRPITEIERIEAMLQYANLLVSAWKGNELVGVARSLTDFQYCCYLSDLAVREDYQKQGIGKALIAETEKSLSSKAKIILLSAPQAVDYYPHIGFTQHSSAWLREV